MWPCFEPFLALAPRLHRLESLAVNSTIHTASQAVEFFSRLPGRGASLRELDLSESRSWLERTPPGSADVEELRAALGRLVGLRDLRARVRRWNADTEPALAGLLAVLRACLGASAAARLELELELHWPFGHNGTLLAAHLPLGRIASLGLSLDAPGVVVPQLCEPGAAAALTALRSLSLLNSCYRELPLELVGRAPWLAQLTQLLLNDRPKAIGRFAGALAPGAMAALQKLRLFADGGWGLPPAAVDAVLAACDPVALRSLSLRGGALADVARLAKGLPALSALHLFCDREAKRRGTGKDPVPVYQTLVSARLTPLTSFELDGSPWLSSRPARLAALLSTPWAASLRKLSLGALRSWSNGEGARALSAALPQLQHLDDLRLRVDVREWSFESDSGSERGGSSSSEESGGADDSIWGSEQGGWSGGKEIGDIDGSDAGEDGGEAAAVWAPRLASFELFVDEYHGHHLHAVLRLPFSPRLKRLTVLAYMGAAPRWFVDQCVRTLPSVKELRVSAVYDD